jgi:hypothetical protein
MPNAETAESSFGSELIAGIMGAGIAIGCVLPPVVHLVTGPIGPFLGGFVAGNKSNPGARGQLIIAVLVGTGVAGILATGAALLMTFATPSELPSWFPSKGTLAAVIGVIWAYGAATAAAGAAVASALAKKRGAREEK